MIKISNVSKAYGSLKALNNISIEINKGTIFGLLGINGAGKSTLLSILNGLSNIDSGEIRIFDFNLKTQKSKIKDISSIIPQNLAFYDNLSVNENIEFFSKVQNAKTEDIQKAIELNKLQDILIQKASTLSGGQKRRLNIAIGLLNNPQIIYFDEPTVGLDPKNRNDILDSILEYKKLGKTIIYTSHYMSEIEKICDEVAIIHKGELVIQDTLDNLLTNKDENIIFIEILYKNKTKELNLNLINDTTIKTDEQNLYKDIELLKQNNIAIKQIKYTSSNLEKYFIEATQ